MVTKIMKDDLKKSSMVALFDMDGTLCDYEGAMNRDLLKLANEGDLKTMQSFGKNPLYLKARMKLIKNQPGWWKYLPPLPIGFQILKIIREYDFKIHVLTKGPYNTPSAWSEKVDWCRANLPEDTSITITEDKGLVYGKILVDDYPVYIQKWLEWRPRGLVIMPASDYNKDFKHHNVIRYDGSEAMKAETIDRVRLASLRK